jgi:hypothetical protein
MIKIHKPSHNYEFESNNNRKLHMIKNKQLRRHDIMITGWQQSYHIIYIYNLQTNNKKWNPNTLTTLITLASIPST